MYLKSALLGVSEIRKEVSGYGVVAVVIIFVVGLLSEILLGIGTRFGIIWPMVRCTQHCL